ncbi:MAG: VOC family protein [Pseudomonadota bacterium]
MTDIGFSHVALECADADKSAAFYAHYAAMKIVHRRADKRSGRQVLWLADGSRPFVLVLIEVAGKPYPLRPIAHLGVGVASRADIDRLAEEARQAGCLALPPVDDGPPAGYYAILCDPDGHALELSHGQEVGLVAGKT